MKGGSEFLFWLIFFAEILLALGIYELINLALKLHQARREIARLRLELWRAQKLLFHRSDSERRARLAWAR